VGYSYSIALARLINFSRSSPKTIIGTIFILTLLAASLRLFRLDNQSFWTDEVSSIINAQAPLDQISEISATLNNCPPTYFLALRPIVGQSKERIEFRARLLSALSGSLSIPLFVGVVWFWRKRWDTALVAGLALAINPLHLWYSQEVRAYALMLLFGLGALLAFELAYSGRGKIWWLVYLVFVIAAVGTHKTGLAIALFCGARHGLDFVRRRQNLAALSIHFIFLLTIGILANLRNYPPTKEYGRPSSILELGYTAMTFVGGYSFGPSLTDIQSHGPIAAVSHHLAQVGILGAVLALSGYAYLSRFKDALLSKESALLSIGIGVVVAGSIVSHFPFNVRYALPALFGFLALFALLVTPPCAQGRTAETNERVGELPRKSGESCKKAFWPGLILGFTVLIVSLWSDIQWYFDANYRKGDSRAVAQWLIEHQTEIKSWTVLPDYLAKSVEWYLESSPEVRSRYLPPKENQFTSFPPVPDVLILGRRHHVPQAEQIINSYSSMDFKVETVRSFAGFELYVRRH
jgi:hypothetical protein